MLALNVVALYRTPSAQTSLVAALGSCKMLLFGVTRLRDMTRGGAGCAGPGDACAKPEDCCTGTVCANGVCVPSALLACCCSAVDGLMLQSPSYYTYCTSYRYICTFKRA
jgi:hypothetical protein